MKKYIAIFITFLFVLSQSAFAHTSNENQDMKILNDFLTSEIRLLSEYKEYSKVHKKDGKTLNKNMQVLLEGKVKSFRQAKEICLYFNGLQEVIERLKDSKLELYEKLRDKDTFTVKLKKYLKNKNITIKNEKNYLTVMHAFYIEYINHYTLNAPSLTPFEDAYINLTALLQEFCVFLNKSEYKYVVKYEDGQEIWYFQNGKLVGEFEDLIQTIDNLYDYIFNTKPNPKSDNQPQQEKFIEKNSHSISKSV